MVSANRDTGTHGPIQSGQRAAALVRSLLRAPWGQISPSVYETGRLVTLAPWLAGHADRLEYLVRAQRPDGGWGGPGGYALVPTLSATEALLATRRRLADGQWPAGERAVDRDSLAAAADRGLRILPGLLRDPETPDTPAIEIIVPALVTAVHRYGPRLPLPDGLDAGLLATIRAGVEAGAPLPEKLLHSLELVAGAPGLGDRVRPAPVDAATATVGASPAATAAWLAAAGRTTPATGGPALAYLRRLVDGHGGPVPSVIPVDAFERAWVLTTFTAAGIAVKVPDELTAAMRRSLGPTGTPGGAGLPPDADTTSVTLLALAQAGRQTDLEALSGYEAETHFRVWPGERTPSTSANAHVLDAYGHRLAGGGPARYARTVHKLSSWLCEQQRSDGSWLDKWHSSPYYATACCALSLHRVGGCEEAVGRAVDWVLATQHGDGSWGVWGGTAEETAYALQMLLLTGTPAHGPAAAVDASAARGYGYLREAEAGEDPPLWHDKDLYLPVAVVRSAILAALHLGAARLATVAAR